MFIKICGITNLADAQLAVELGAHAIGFIFAESKRRVSPQIACPIIRQLPESVAKVGVFVNETMEEIISIVRETGLTVVQLHRNSNKAEYAQLSQVCRVIQVIKVTPDGEMQPISNVPAWKILLDTYLPGVVGGSGKQFKWDVLFHLNLENIIVAGGINPDNVAGLLQRYRPFGIDLSSGVESVPGKKDPQKLVNLFEQIERFAFEQD